MEQTISKSLDLIRMMVIDKRYDKASYIGRRMHYELGKHSLFSIVIDRSELGR